RRLATMTSPDLAGTAIVTDEGEARRELGASRRGPCERGGSASLARYDPEKVVIRATAQERGVLVLSDAWFAGWKAKVDGKRATVLRVDHALRGVALPPGSHTVEMEFRPTSQSAGEILSVATILVILGASAMRGGGRRGAAVSRRRR
ncbi:MAG: YfhO family protein, partial [Actinobacteria bacterium]|nr:YfhO family protein [Actinomycetota bacterium]